MGAGKHLQADQVEIAASTVCFSPWGEGDDCGDQGG